MNENDNFLVKTAKVRDIFLIYLQSYLLHPWLIDFHTNRVSDWLSEWLMENKIKEEFGS